MPPAPEPSLDDLQARLSSLNLTKITSYPLAHPCSNPVDVFRCYISEQLVRITGVAVDIVYSALEWTLSFDKGDLIMAVPRLRVKGVSPKDLATKWASEFPENPYVYCTVSGTFLQFFFKEDKLPQIVLPEILKRKENYGPINTGKGKKVIIEFSSPNIAKPFHAGHLRSTIIGGFLSNLHESCGWEVTRMNYLGDWGKQFGVLGVGFKRFGSEEKLLADPIHHLYEVYVEINKILEKEKKDEAKKQGLSEKDRQTYNGPTDEEAKEFFVKMEAGDPDYVGLWKRFRDLSIEKYKETYARLNIKYDVYSGESQVLQESMNKATAILAEREITEDSDGAVIINFTKNNETKKLDKAVLRKKDGTSLYLTRDIGAAMERFEKFKFDKMIYVIANQQDLHVAQLFATLKMMGFEWADRCQHVNFGMVHGMSTRKGTVVFLDDILAEAKESMHAVMKKNEEKYCQVENPDFVADTVGRTGIMIQDMTGKRINGYTFDINRITSFEGDTGPYLQYAHARLCSVGRKAALTREDVENADLSLLTESHATNLVRVLAQYPDVLQNTLKTLEPTTVVTYLFKMTHLLSSSYDVLNVVRAEPEVKKARMALYEGARQVLHNGMELLGLVPVDRM